MPTLTDNTGTTRKDPVRHLLPVPGVCKYVYIYLSRTFVPRGPPSRIPRFAHPYIARSAGVANRLPWPSVATEALENTMSEAREKLRRLFSAVT